MKTSKSAKAEVPFCSIFGQPQHSNADFMIDPTPDTSHLPQWILIHCRDDAFGEFDGG